MPLDVLTQRGTRVFHTSTAWSCVDCHEPLLVGHVSPVARPNDGVSTGHPAPHSAAFRL